MLLGTYFNALELRRDNKIIFARFLKPFSVLSTCSAAGGLRTDLSCVLNHQSCEPNGHATALPTSLISDPDAYRASVCGPRGLEPGSCATLGTAANMNHAALVQESYRDQSVLTVCTAGVEGNAGRAGDPASLYEDNGRFESLTSPAPPPAGTINLMLFINQALTPGAMVTAVITATEAKCAALQELNVNSRYSPEPATGTGTDQIAVCCPKEDGNALTSAGKHAKLGELIGRAVGRALEQSLELENQLTPAGQCSARLHLERLGADRKRFEQSICGRLTPGQARLFRENYDRVNRDPLTVAGVAALVHMRDKLAWGVLPASCRGEVLGSQAAQVAAAASGDYSRLPHYRELLAPAIDQDSDRAVVDLACRALALGFSEKWQVWPEE